MHGLINRSLQCFLGDTYGNDLWRSVTSDARLSFDNFEALLTYEASVTKAVISAACDRLSTTRDMLLEDLGTYLVSHSRMSALRRLLRLGGESYVEFLHSLDDLQDRARLAVSDLQFPALELRDHLSGHYSLTVTHRYEGFGHTLLGMLRAMADDYGALVFLEHHGRSDQVETISIELIELSYATGNDFALAAGA